MTLVRVYCGISSAGEAGQIGAVARLTVAVVDDSGRLLEACEINDDPAGYAALTAFLVERFGGSTAVTVAVDDDEHLMVSLLAASGRFIAFTDDGTADDFADRFADDDSLEEVNAAAAERRAVGLARALQAGALQAGATNPPREYAALRPVLAAHAALAVGRHAAAVALREVLRELYPAALRAYPDPASPVALAMLDALPEPSLLTAAAGRGRDAAVTVANRLVADGVCDNETALEAVTALRVAITETPRRNGVGKRFTAAVADAVRASVAAVRSADSATTVLIKALADKIAPDTGAVATPVPRRRPAPAPITTVTPAPRPVSPPPMAPAPMAPTPVSPAPMPVAVPPMPVAVPPMPVAVPPMPVAVPAVPVPVAAAVPVSPGRPAWTQSTPPPMPPGFEPTPVTGSPIVPMVPAQRQAPVAPVPVSAAPVAPTPVSAAPVAPAPVSASPATLPPAAPVADPLTPFVPTLTNAAINSERASRGLGRTPPPQTTPVSASPQQHSDPLPSRSDWPLNPVHEDDAVSFAPPSPSGPPPLTAPKRVPPPWQADDLVLPSLRLVDPAPTPTSTAAPLRLVDDPLTGPSPLSAPPLSSPSFSSPPLSSPPLSSPPLSSPPLSSPPLSSPPLSSPPLSSRPLSSPPLSSPPLASPPHSVSSPSSMSSMSSLDDERSQRIPKPRRTERMPAPPAAEDDTDLLIFASVSSAWFSGEGESEGESTWNSAMDTGWRAAEEASLRPTVAGESRAGLPQRVPAANLVPGSPLTVERPLRIVRDADEIAAHTSSYFRGWRKGTQEAGGYAVGGRPGRESANGWDFSRDHELRDERAEHHHRAVNYR